MITFSAHPSPQGVSDELASEGSDVMAEFLIHFIEEHCVYLPELAEELKNQASENSLKKLQEFGQMLVDLKG